MADVNRGPGIAGRYLPLFVSLSLSHSTCKIPQTKLANLYLRKIFPAIRKPQKLYVYVLNHSLDGLIPFARQFTE